MNDEPALSPRFRGWTGWQATPLLPQDCRELHLRLGLVRNQIVMCQVEMRDPSSNELLGLISNPSLGGLTPQEAAEWLHEFLDEALDYAEEWNAPFP